MKIIDKNHIALPNQPSAQIVHLSGTPFFDKLPRELRDEVYRYAFVEEPGRVLRYATRSRRQMKAMHVSRQFEAEAVQEWYRHHIIDCPNINFFRYLCSRDDQFQNNVINLWPSWDRSHSVEGNNIGIISAHDNIRNCDRLRTLRLKVFEPIFDISDNGDDEATYLRDHNYGDLWSIQEVQDLCTLPALQKVTLIPAEGWSAVFEKTPEEAAKWLENVQKLENFISDFLHQRGTSNLLPHHAPSKLDITSFPVHREKMTRFIASTPGGCAGCGGKICRSKRAAHNQRASR
ncbi:hypothetical protein HII31_08229 [Pseudocercospora fuligena]|uniref:F-box domain-containing protein n=1 Tax=Pseudocercospora fuligena TaxID=685502 RepID=A0A8H6RET2_9PEZI|nr:hypothetical protein HII31_08229 [Pseudocercospora fuligena]